VKPVDKINSYEQLVAHIKGIRSGIFPVDRLNQAHWAKLLEAIQSQELENLHIMIREAPILFGELVCKAILGIADEGVQNPFAVTGDGKPMHESPTANWRREMAEILSVRINGEKVTKETDEFSLLRDLMIDHVYYRDYFYWPHFLDPSPEGVIAQFFKTMEDEFGAAIYAQCELVYHGVPLFEKDQDTENFSPVPTEAEDYLYLWLKGKRDSVPKEQHLPFWAKKYFFKREHLKAYEIFFYGKDQQNEFEIEVLRTAFRRHIGFDEYPSTKPKIISTRTHKTRLLGLVDTVIERYYGRNFDPMNNDTWPSQEVIKSWLKSEHALSDREATSIDIIARPDNIRGK
jgi:hypothetical protein